MTCRADATRRGVGEFSGTGDDSGSWAAAGDRPAIATSRPRLKTSIEKYDMADEPSIMPSPPGEYLPAPLAAGGKGAILRAVGSW